MNGLLEPPGYIGFAPIPAEVVTLVGWRAEEEGAKLGLAEAPLGGPAPLKLGLDEFLNGAGLAGKPLGFRKDWEPCMDPDLGLLPVCWPGAGMLG